MKPTFKHVYLDRAELRELRNYGWTNYRRTIKRRCVRLCRREAARLIAEQLSN